MEQTDAVSCALCLRADEYGSMIVILIPVLGQPEPADRVICRECCAQVAREYSEVQLGEVKEARTDEPAKSDQGD